MILEIITVVEIALLATLVLIPGAFAVLLRDLLQRWMRGCLRVMVVVVLAPACALAATGISAGIGSVLASTLGPDEPPAHTEPAQEDLERTAERRETLSATATASA